MDIGALGVYMALFLALYFEVFLLISFIERRPSKKTIEEPPRFPVVSMIVPCWNEEKTLATTVNSLLKLHYPKDKLEIIVVNDGSTDQTRAIAERLAEEHPQVTFLHKENGGKYTALNLGIERARGEFVGCLDADSFVAEDALREMVKRFEADPAIMALTPSMKVHQPRTLLELMQAVEYTFGIFYKKMFDNLSAVNVLPGPFSIYRKSVFSEIGMFKHAHNTEDMEIAFRLHSRGHKIANAHTAFVYTTVPTTLRALVRQRTRWSQGFLQNSRDYRHMYFNPRFGHFGMLILPFGLTAFAAGLYVAGYALYHLLSYVGEHVFSIWKTGIPPHIPTGYFEWYYVNTSMLTFLIVMTIGMTFLAIALGQKISNTRLSVKSFFSYFAFFGFIAPVWLARAAWGAVRAQESAWR